MIVGKYCDVPSEVHDNAQWYRRRRRRPHDDIGNNVIFNVTKTEWTNDHAAAAAADYRNNIASAVSFVINPSEIPFPFTAVSALPCSVTEQQQTSWFGFPYKIFFYPSHAVFFVPVPTSHAIFSVRSTVRRPSNTRRVAVLRSVTSPSKMSSGCCGGTNTKKQKLYHHHQTSSDANGGTGSASTAPLDGVVGKIITPTMGYFCFDTLYSYLNSLEPPRKPDFTNDPL